MRQDVLNKHRKLLSELNDIDLTMFVLPCIIRDHSVSMLNSLIKKDRDVFQYIELAQKVITTCNEHKLPTVSKNAWGTVLNKAGNLRKTIRFSHTFKDVTYKNNVSAIIQPLNVIISDNYTMIFIPNEILQDYATRTGKNSFEFEVPILECIGLTPLSRSSAIRMVANDLLILKLKYPEIFDTHNFTC